MAVLRNFGFNL